MSAGEILTILFFDRLNASSAILMTFTHVKQNFERWLNINRRGRNPNRSDFFGLFDAFLWVKAFIFMILNSI
jgi:hypothetical protein